MVVLGRIPSRWSEAAKGIFQVKRIPWTGVRLAQRSAPVAIYEDEPPRSGWADILELAERLAPQSSLVPAEAAGRATTLALAHAIWASRDWVVRAAAGCAALGEVLRAHRQMMYREHLVLPLSL